MVIVLGMLQLNPLSSLYGIVLLSQQCCGSAFLSLDSYHSTGSQWSAHIVRSLTKHFYVWIMQCIACHLPMKLKWSALCQLPVHARCHFEVFVILGQQSTKNAKSPDRLYNSLAWGLLWCVMHSLNVRRHVEKLILEKMRDWRFCDRRRAN